MKTDEGAVADFHILVIEDNPGDIELWREALVEARLSYRMTVLSDGEGAADYICNEQRTPDPIDLILLDINLPKLDGLSLLESIRNTPRCASVPVMVTTSSSSPMERERVGCFPGTRLVVKPSDLDGFLEIGTVVNTYSNGAGPIPRACHFRITLNVILNAMTKVQLTFHLSRSLTEKDMVNIGRMHSVYGFFVVRPSAAETELFVEYDASRLSPKEVRGSLEEHGLPLANPPAAQAPVTGTNIAS